MHNHRSAVASTTQAGPTEVCGLAEPGSVDAVYLDHALLLRRVAIRKFNIPPPDADGLVHDVFINLLVLAERAKPRDVRGYLIAAICNASRNYWRSRRTESRVFADDEISAHDVTSDEDTFETVSMRLIVGSILAKLGTRCREVLRRYYLDGQDTPTIAAAILTTCANVNYLMHSCRKKARAIYDGITRVG